MKSLKNIEEQYTPQEIAESFIFPGTKNKKEREAMLSEFRTFRKKISTEQSEESKVISKLLQLKFLIEDYITTNSSNGNFDFGYFLQEYIKRLEKKNNQFANEIGVDPAELSQVINKHRKPTEKFILRLDIHSNNNFPAAMWLKLLAKERVYELEHNKQIINNEKRYVKQKLQFSF
jgi:plasmid maintenance system antidote protein VapI